MDRLIYLSMAGAKASMQRQDSLANNLANVSTAGFRAELHAFRAVPVEGSGASTRVYALESTPGYDASPGVISNTGRPLALLLIDVDHFKRYNDTHGHQAGDRCLQVVAELLLDSISQTDGVAARYGGEEFAVLLQGPDGLEPTAFAEKLRTHVAQLQLPTENGGKANLTISIGVAVAAQQEDEASLVATADRRLYRAKSDGRNRVSDNDDAERLLGQA